MNDKDVLVFSFRGRAYHGKPGIEFRPLEVQEDFGEWRPAKSQDGKRVAGWLVAHGYRLAWRTMGRGDAVDYQEWWAKAELLSLDGKQWAAYPCHPSDLRMLLAHKLAGTVPEGNPYALVDGDGNYRVREG